MDYFSSVNVISGWTVGKYCMWKHRCVPANTLSNLPEISFISESKKRSPPKRRVTLLDCLSSCDQLANEL